MRHRLQFFLYLFIFWLIVHLSSKLVFLIYHFQQLKETGLSIIPGVFWYGLKLDLSATGYLMALPAVFLIILSMAPAKIVKPVFDTYVIILLVIMGFLLSVDIELYRHWGFRLDHTPLLYIDNPDLMMASVEIWVIIKQVAIMLLFSGSMFMLYRRFVSPLLKQFKPEKIYTSLIFILLLGSLIIPVRGGFGIAPVNVGTAYFHHDVFANHAAINVYWNLGYSLSKMKSGKNPYKYFKEEKAENIFRSLFPETKKNENIILKTRPNIVFIVLESFTAKAIEPLDGLPGVTPHFNQLAGEGVLFENIFASGDRTDKAFVSIMSGYPAQPDQSIIKLPKKTQTLPNICRILVNDNYNTMFCYGGDADFANFRSYLSNSGFRKIISLKDFDSKHNTSKWGVHDHIVFDRFFEELNKNNEPFFSVLLTQSSHEPFDVPHKSEFAGESETELFLNSIHYTDSCLGAFFEKVKHEDWYENTLFVLVADHGARNPGNNKVFEPQRFHIPMLWLGKAIHTEPAKVDKYGSQFDLATTLLNQLGYEHNEFIFGKDLLSENTPSHSFYVFNNGFGFLTDSAFVAFDNRAKLTVFQEGSDENVKTNLERGKAMLQMAFEDFLKR